MNKGSSKWKFFRKMVHFNEDVVHFDWLTSYASFKFSVSLGSICKNISVET